MLTIKRVALVVLVLSIVCPYFVQSKAVKTTNYDLFPKNCNMGQHPKAGKCNPNTDYCKKNQYNAATYSCKKCVWYAFFVKNITQGSNTGNYCESRWWLLVVVILSSLLLLL